MEHLHFIYTDGDVCAALCCSVVSDSATPRPVARQAPLSRGFSRQEYWSGFACPAPGNLPNPGIKAASPSLAGGFFTPSAAWDALINGSCPIRPSCCSPGHSPTRVQASPCCLQEQRPSLLLKSAAASTVSVLGLSESFTKRFFEDSSIPSPLKDVKSR